MVRAGRSLGGNLGKRTNTHTLTPPFAPDLQTKKGKRGACRADMVKLTRLMALNYYLVPA